MARPRVSHVIAEAARRERALLAELGADVRDSRVRRHWTQRELAARAGMSQSGISELERGLGGSLSLATWERLAVALDRQLGVRFSRDPQEEPVDAGHLVVQELILRLARNAGRGRSFEMPTRRNDPSLSADVCLRDDRRATLVLVECWNTITDIGASARSFDRKLADLGSASVALWPERDAQVRGCWVVRATRRNRSLVGRYPEVFAARFPGSSQGWARALVADEAPPRDPGLVWCDVPGTRLYAWRARG